MFNPVLQEILTTQMVTDAQGEKYPVRFNISRAEGDFITNLIRSNDVQATLEIGCAYGVSAQFICDALSKKPNHQHTIEDPNQTTEYKSIGIDGLRRAGFDWFELIEEPSELALPNLLRQGKRFDLALIDGWHTFDHAMIDFFYVNRMLKVGGIVIFDDASWPSVHRLVRYVSAYPAYEVIGGVGHNPSGKRRAWHGMRQVLGGALRWVPSKARKDIFDDALFRSSEALGIRGTMVALRKIAEDDRTWKWYKEF